MYYQHAKDELFLAAELYNRHFLLPNQENNRSLININTIIVTNSARTVVYRIIKVRTINEQETINRHVRYVVIAYTGSGSSRVE